MRVSVIIPCYNVEAYIEKALRSVMEQTYADLDIHVVDDGSTDGTRAKLIGLSERYNGRFQWETLERGGAGRARNRGLARTTGDYVQFLDADDVLWPEKISGQVVLAMKHERPALIIGGYRNSMSDGTTDDVLPGVGDAWMSLIRTKLGTTTADLWKRSALLEVGGWDEELKSSQDYELAFRIMRSGGRAVMDPRVVATIVKRVHGSIGRVDEWGNWKRYIALRASIRSHLLALDPLKYRAEIAETDQYIFRAVRVLAKTDPRAAMQLHAAHIPSDFIPMPGEALSRPYALVHRCLGFRSAEFAASVLDNLRRLTGRK